MLCWVRSLSKSTFEMKIVGPTACFFPEHIHFWKFLSRELQIGLYLLAYPISLAGWESKLFSEKFVCFSLTWTKLHLNGTGDKDEHWRDFILDSGNTTWTSLCWVSSADILTSYRLEVPMTSTLVSTNLLEQLTELRETLYLLDCWFIIKGRKSRRA